jgi:hypothetical protein
LGRHGGNLISLNQEIQALVFVFIERKSVSLFITNVANKELTHTKVVFFYFRKNLPA